MFYNTISYRNQTELSCITGDYVVNEHIPLNGNIPKFIYIETKVNSTYDNRIQTTRIYLFRKSENSWFGHISYISNIVTGGWGDISSNYSDYIAFTENNENIFIKYSATDAYDGTLNGVVYQKYSIYY